MSTDPRTAPAKNAQRLIDLSRRFATPDETPDAVPTPSFSGDLISELHISKNISLDNGNDHTIDVQPDYRLPFISLTYLIIRIFPEFDVRPHPSVTPMTIMAYFLLCLYGYALACDSHSRRSKSFFCNEFHRSPNARDLLTSLLGMHIPEFMIDFIIALSPTSDPRRPGIEFVNTFAGYNHEHDIFRTPSPLMFLHAHHILATTRTNADPRTIMNLWYDTIFFSHTGATPRDFKIAQFFGTNYTQAAAMHTHANWLNNCIETLFNPVVSRSLSNRPTYRPIPIVFPSQGDYNVNPYDYLLGSSDDNIYTMTQFLDSMSSFFEQSPFKTMQLGSIFQRTSGISILSHYMSEPPLPTWHNLEVDSTGDTAPIPDTDRVYANIINYLGRPANQPETELPYPPDTATIAPSLYLVDATTSTPNSRDEDWLQFDSSKHVYPMVRLFDPYDYLPSKFAYPIITGLTIESFELDGFTVPNTNPHSSLNDENDQFLQSALAFGCIQPATFAGFNPRIDRTVTYGHNQKILISLWNYALNRLPMFARNIANSAVPTALPGFTPHAHTRSTQYSTNHYSFMSNERFVIPRHINAWSSYRFVRRYQPDRNHDILILLSFRPFYGTNITLAESRHPASLIPR